MMKEEDTRIRIERLYRDNHEAIAFTRKIISGQCNQIATIFYKEMLADPEGSKFLDNNVVQDRLHVSMSQWVKSIFNAEIIEDIDKFIDWQSEIGHVHARIKMPMHLFTKGIRILKCEIFQRLINSDLSREALAMTLLTVGELLDNLTDLINLSYMDHTVQNERSIHALQLEMVNGNLALECERLRLSLSEWHRDTLLILYSKEKNILSQIRDIKDTDYGLWVIHKMELLFTNNPYAKKQHILLSHINQLVKNAISNRTNTTESRFEKAITVLNGSVKDASYLLGSMIEQLCTIESSRDPLTQMLSRRYLPVIMQRENEICRNQDLIFAVIFVDLDHFKEINDTYGHGAGDQVLSSVAGIIRNSLRSGDFAFRYGGEEFLILLANSSEQRAKNVAERLRERIESQSIQLHGNDINITASIGIALSNGHPDYEKVISRADSAVYQAKSNGRNQCILSA